MMNSECSTDIHHLLKAPADGPREDPFLGETIPDCLESQLYVISGVAASNPKWRKTLEVVKNVVPPL